MLPVDDMLELPESIEFDDAIELLEIIEFPEAIEFAAPEFMLFEF